MTVIDQEKPIRNAGDASTSERAIRPRRTTRLSTRNIPPALIYEMWQGKPVYYRGYRDVLAGKKTIEEVMSCSDLQGVLVSLEAV